MALSLTNYTSIIRHAVGTPSWLKNSPDAARQITNDAGRFIISAHPWKWLNALPAAASISLTAGTADYDLPSDFIGLLSWSWIYAHARRRLRHTTLDDIVAKRAQKLHPDTLYFAIFQPDQTDQTGLMPIQKISFAPTPAYTEASAIQLSYRRGWTDLDDGADIPNMPIYMEALMHAVVRAFAEAWEDLQHGRAEERMAIVLQSPFFATAVAMDGRLHPDALRHPVAQTQGAKG
jgi:hypothetical protein